MRKNLLSGVLATILFTLSSPAQSSGYLSLAPVSPVKVKAGQSVEVVLTARVKDGFHVNSHQPKEDYLIPFRLQWKSGPLMMSGVVFPKPELVKYDFAEQPLSVFTGEIPIKVRFQVPKDAKPGEALESGEILYQACNSTTCFPRKTLPVQVPVIVSP